MTNNRTGQLILDLRREQGLTQKQLAASLNVSDRTISKWERGLGYPDVFLLGKLSETFGVNIEKILSGDLGKNPKDAGNLRNLKFYQCSNCGSVLTALGNQEIHCCGRKLEALVAEPADEHHRLNVEEIENDLYITFSHEMSRKHYIRFFAYVGFDRVLLVRLYPEQAGEVRFPRMQGRTFFYCCNQHGLKMCK